MNARFDTFQAAFFGGMRQIATAVAIAFAGASAAFAQTTASTAASEAAPATAAVADAAASQITVKPGQSLNDVAISSTQSHDRAVLARASKAIFDANPNAFMQHDPSRMRVGAVLNVPTLDATGAAASGAAASAVSAAAPAASSSASAAPVSTASAAVQTGASSAAAAASSSGTGASASAVEASSAPVAGSQPAGAIAPASAAVSGTHASNGSEAAVAGSAANTGQAATANGTQPAPQAHPQVSSLQQLLALKNRVLMELQKHGIGGSKQATTASNNPATPTAQASGATPGVTASAAAPAVVAPAQPANNAPAGVPQEYLAGAAVVGAGLVALLAGWSMRRRKKAQAEAAAAQVADRLPSRETRAFPPADVAQDDIAGQPVAGTPEPSAPAHVTPPETEASDLTAVPTLEHIIEPTTFGEASAEASLDAAASLGADALPPESLDASRAEARAADIAAAKLAARESTAQVSKPTSEAVSEAPRDETRSPLTTPPAFDMGAMPEIAPSAVPVVPPAPSLDFNEPEAVAQHEQLIEPYSRPSVDNHAESHAAEPSPLPAFVPPVEFPREAVDALGSLDAFALPPRIDPVEPVEQVESAASVEPEEPTAAPPISLTTPPVAELGATAQQAVPDHVPESPRVADEIIAGTVGTAAIAGLGAARFGALNLDFDLELPPGPGQVLPAFTPEELARIARNKLELAAEYIDLGDVLGARTLINEVIESNDTGTRVDARKMLSTLAPLS